MTGAASITVTSGTSANHTQPVHQPQPLLAVAQLPQDNSYTVVSKTSALTSCQI